MHVYLLGGDLYFILVFDTEDIMHESECLFEKTSMYERDEKRGIHRTFKFIW